MVTAMLGCNVYLEKYFMKYINFEAESAGLLVRYIKLIYSDLKI